jgi:hypothetical protein
MLPYCRDCQTWASHATGRIEHKLGCSTGQVLHWLEQLPDDLPAITDEELVRDARLTIEQHRDLSGLMFEARSLARHQITTHIPGVELCRECLQVVERDGLLGHTPECRAGKVLTRLAALCEDRRENRKLLPPAEGSATGPSAGFFSELGNYNEPWSVRGSREQEEGFIDRVLRTVVADRSGTHIVDTADGDCGEPMQRAFAERIALCMNFCAALPGASLEAVIAKYGIRGFALMAYPVERFAVGVLAAIRAFLDEDARRVAERAFAVTPSTEAPAAAEEVSAKDDADGEPCARCGHACLDHDDEFGNCTAIPNPYGMNQRDGCDCEGYQTAEEAAEAERRPDVPRPAEEC